ncbi:asparaginase [Terrihabitans sp. B22-R8]|uniref:asparaginase n=1 Tax=Terrihabitans sp. B22-R8 TaxID=3425128 RepID=UPI00403C70AB
MSKPKVQVIVLGGTITMMPAAEGGITPSLRGEDLVAAVPGLSDVAGIEVTTPFLKPGSSLSFEDLAEVSRIIGKALDDGAAGVVVVQGTDTIDESSFVLDLLHTGPQPVVVTGAMRGAAAAGADGPANLLAAVTVAASGIAELGVCVVLNDEIHAARFVAKGHTALPSAFVSPGFGPIGHVLEGVARVLLKPVRIDCGLAGAPQRPARVAVIKICIGDDGRLISAALGAGYEGLVIEAMGAGHLPMSVLDAVTEAAASVPVVLATRVPGGPVYRETYGFPGSERDLIARGLIPAGYLAPPAARILTALLLGSGASRERIAASFAAYG